MVGAAGRGAVAFGSVSSAARRVAIVPHTHWDREWYEPFQTFRYRLVELLDRLLPLLESDPSYARFLLDGQMAVIDDYLEVRPEAEERLRGLAASGRLGMGPWYVLPDEFLVSGETLIRDLQLGLSRGAAFGGSMEIGYLPDMFGHVAQMPQILRLAGFEHAVVWRGVPSAVTTTGFWWEAPDGSRVRAEYLPKGYANGAALPDDAKALIKRINDIEAELSGFLLGPLLVMNGSDHLLPQPNLGRVVADANVLQSDYDLEITSLPEYLAETPREGLVTWRGELRSGARANVLMGVVSNRVDVKQSAARTERALERRAEPLAALFLPADAWPVRLLDLAWLGVVHNAAHDSICACSVDEVVDAVLHRFAESRQIADRIATDAMASLSRSLAEPGPVVVNPTARSRGGLVELTTAGDQPPPHTQLVSASNPLPGSLTLDADAVRTLLGMIHGSRLGDDMYVQDVTVREDAEGLDVHVSLGTEERPVAISEAKQEIYTRLGARPEMAVRIRLDQPHTFRVLARVSGVPGFGWQRFAPSPLEHPVTSTGGGSAAARESAEGDPTGGNGGARDRRGVVLGNGLVEVRVDPDDGTFAVDGLQGLGRLVDGGDHGDSYNYSPPAHDEVVDRPLDVQTSIEQRGPLRTIARIVSHYEWPDRVDGPSARRVGRRDVEVTTHVEVRADERIVRVRHTFVNPSCDHRLRVHLPLPEPAAYSQAECAFATVTRGLVAEGRPEELGLPTFPSRRFVQAGGLTVCHDGLHEYELVDIEETSQGPRARTLAITLLRSTGMLSRLGMSHRPFPAGPLTPVPGLQLRGRPITASYALVLGETDPWAVVDDVLLPLEVVQCPGGGWRPPQGSELSVEGGVVTAVLRRAGVLEVRVCNPAPTPTEIVVPLRSGWLVDLRGRPLAPFNGSFPLGPWAIATLRLTGP
jgi:mannosylglycerate hydrolase